MSVQDVCLIKESEGWLNIKNRDVNKYDTGNRYFPLQHSPAVLHCNSFGDPQSSEFLFSQQCIFPVSEAQFT